MSHFYAAGRERNWSQQTLSTLAEMHQLILHLTGQMADLGYGEEDLFHVRLAVEEAIANAIKHGHRADPSKQVRIFFSIGFDQVLIKVQDQGQGFDPRLVPDPLATENMDRISGRGLYLMQATMSWIEFNEQGNCVTLCKQRVA